VLGATWALLLRIGTTRRAEEELAEERAAAGAGPAAATARGGVRPKDRKR
jgi:hypothetical protein